MISEEVMVDKVSLMLARAAASPKTAYSLVRSARMLLMISEDLLKNKPVAGSRDRNRNHPSTRFTPLSSIPRQM